MADSKITKIRIFHLAKELGVSNAEIIDVCHTLGINAKTHSSTIETNEADRIKSSLQKHQKPAAPQASVKPKPADAPKAEKSAPTSSAPQGLRPPTQTPAAPVARPAQPPQTHPSGQPQAQRPAGQPQRPYSSGQPRQDQGRPPYNQSQYQRPGTSRPVSGNQQTPGQGNYRPAPGQGQPRPGQGPYRPAPGQGQPRPGQGPYRPAPGQGQPRPGQGPYRPASGQGQPRPGQGNYRPAPGQGPYRPPGQGQSRPGQGPYRPQGQGQQRPGQGDHRTGTGPRPPIGPDIPVKAAFKPTREAPPSKSLERKPAFHDKKTRESAIKQSKGRSHRRRGQPTVTQPAPEIKAPVVPDKITITGVPTIQILADKMNLRASDLIKKAMMLGKMVTINQRLDEEMVFLLAAEYNTEVEYVTEKEDEDSLRVKVTEAESTYTEPRGPVVTIMGHVDHGKTSLLDAIRHTNVTGGEFGGITQHIGAYEVTINNKNIVFLDTPGHEAFTAMRARGAKVTDIVILVVSAIDGMMPQTIEAIHHSQAANVPIIVAINKMDLPDANPLRIKQQLSEHGLLPEDWGGKTIFAEVSAKKRINIEGLLEMILLQADIMELKANPKVSASGIVVEAKLDRGRGPVATVLLQEGTLNTGEPFVCGTTHGKVRAMLNDKGELRAIAGPGKAMEIIGFSAVPEAGNRFLVVQSEKIAREVAYKREMQKREEDLITRHHISLDDLSSKIATGEVKELAIIIKGDVQGSIGALTDALTKLSTDKVKLSVIHSGVGAITESDVLLASASNAIIIGFHVRPEPNATELAKREGVDIRMYRIIYDTVNEVKAAMAGLLGPTFKEHILGRTVVRQLFKLSKVGGSIAGCFVQSGKIQRNAKVRLIRDNKVVYEGIIGSLKRFKEDTKEVTEGYECGLTIENYSNLQEGDIIEAYTLEEIAAVL